MGVIAGVEWLAVEYLKADRQVSVYARAFCRKWHSEPRKLKIRLEVLLCNCA